MTENSKIPLYKRPFFYTFLWVWGVCFLFIYGFSPVFTIIEPSSQISLPYLVFLSIMLSLPVGLSITGVLLFFRHRMAGSRTEIRLTKDKEFSIAIGIIMLGFFIALVGMHVTIYTHLRLGRLLVLAGVGLGVLSLSLFWLKRLIK